MVTDKKTWVRCRGNPLALWSCECFERIGNLIGTFVEVDKACVAKDILKFVRLCVKIPLGGESSWVKQVWINDTMCQISIEEECVTPDSLLQRFHNS